MPRPPRRAEQGRGGPSRPPPSMRCINRFRLAACKRPRASQTPMNSGRKLIAQPKKAAKNGKRSLCSERLPSSSTSVITLCPLCTPCERDPFPRKTLAEARKRPCHAGQNHARHTQTRQKTERGPPQREPRPRSNTLRPLRALCIERNLLLCHQHVEDRRARPRPARLQPLRHREADRHRRLAHPAQLVGHTL
jgi:hypothetical protein